MVEVLEGTLGKSFEVHMDTYMHGPMGEILGEAVCVNVAVVYSQLGDNY